MSALVNPRKVWGLVIRTAHDAVPFFGHATESAALDHRSDLPEDMASNPVEYIQTEAMHEVVSALAEQRDTAMEALRKVRADAAQRLSHLESMVSIDDQRIAIAEAKRDYLAGELEDAENDLRYRRQDKVARLANVDAARDVVKALQPKDGGP